MAVHHRRRGRQVEAVGFVHHLDPLLDRRFGGRDGFPHAGIEDLGPGTRQGVQSGGDQPFQGVERGEAADAGDVRHFGRSEGVQAYLRIEALECREELLVEIDPQLRV